MKNSKSFLRPLTQLILKVRNLDHRSEEGTRFASPVAKLSLKCEQSGARALNWIV